jgi:hypothetical protein
MAPSHTPKPATARDTREPASKVERFPGELDNLNIPQRRQIQCLIKRHALTWATAELLAPLVFGEMAR